MKLILWFSISGVIGCIDGSHIPIRAPHDLPSSYVNRKGFHSILLQAVCDHELRFLDCYAGEVGSIHDACMLRRSDFMEKLNNDAFFPSESHVLGDPAYPLMDHLLVAFKDTGRLTSRERKFNTTLSAARCTIERALALLKNRFRRLKYLDMTRVDLVPQVIIACCILHNMCLTNGDILDDSTDTIDCDHTHVQSDDFGGSVLDAAVRRAGVRKRDKIADLLCCK